MFGRTLVLSASLLTVAGSVSAQGTTLDALRIAAEQGACGTAAAIEAAEYIDGATIRVTCVRPAGANNPLGGGLGPLTTTTAGITFIAIISALGGDDDGGSNGTSGTSGT
ncbi:hypothetical protein SAMN05421759_107114 [Roseivivax lentus]|uniref:Uncharacterized protein n=1 Tax=Roseivivax lentus TaxID=633194 RepID=A0A1N7N9R8_9RHOB|nr:hypothetical protein [Roseivivax lentus]SIS95123.1 hypothetical protein SAMN05421759_107114 [Roseivivax lentus]